MATMLPWFIIGQEAFQRYFLFRKLTMYTRQSRAETNNQAYQYINKASYPNRNPSINEQYTQTADETTACKDHCLVRVGGDFLLPEG